LDWASHLEVLWEQPFVQELVSSLERFARVLWFDMRGIGLSDRALDAPAAPEDWLDDVAAVMDAAGSERAALVAHGHAAQMALLAAAIHPDRIDSLVLLNGFARFARARTTTRRAGPRPATRCSGRDSRCARACTPAR
jgi:pimeloyl-ACP methyl ester carboxylesterase